MTAPVTKPYGRRDTILPLQLFDDPNGQGADDSEIMVEGGEIEAFRTF